MLGWLINFGSTHRDKDLSMKLTAAFFCLLFYLPAFSQQDVNESITRLIADYAQARETQDTVLLSSILTDDIDQLVSSGEWRRGKEGAFKGMMRSSSGNTGTRTLTVEHIRLLSAKQAIVDARYEINQDNGSIRKMWSTFIVVKEKGKWKISAIRNMLPAR